MKKACLCGAALVLSSMTFAQDYLAKNEYFYNLVNRLNLLVIRDSAAQDVSMGIAFKCGSFHEASAYDGLSFIYERIISERLRQQLIQSLPEYGGSPGFFPLTSETTYEYVMVRFSFPKNYLQQVLQVLYRTVSEPFGVSEIQEAAAFSTSELQRLLRTPSFGMEQKIGADLWENDYSKRTVLSAWNDSTAALIPARLHKMRSEYFCPRNCLLVVKGDVQHKPVYEAVKESFQNWDRCTINPFTKFPAPNYRMILNSLQLVDENPLTEHPFFRIAFPGPNTFENKRSNYCALVLASLLSLPGTKTYGIMRDSCQLASVSMSNDLAENISQITFEFTPREGSLALGYKCFINFLNNLYNAALSMEEMETGKEEVISSFREAQSDNDRHIAQIVKFWASVSLNGYSTFTDSIRSLTVNDMKTLIERYFHKRNYVAALSIHPEKRISTSIDTIFTGTCKDIKSFRLAFLKNSARLAGAKDDSTLNSVIQFLKINPGLKIKVNGVCHKDELLLVNDKAMTAWVRSLGDNFIMNPPSLTGKRRFRLDVYRSLTIIKKLIDSGIDSKRLFGTGNLVRTPGETEKYQYVHFTQVN